MALAYAILLAALGLVAIIAISLQSFFFRRAERRRKEKEIQKQTCSERNAEKKRVERVKQLARQDKIGDEIVWPWILAWRRAGSPPNRRIFRIRRNFGQNQADAVYSIWVGRRSSDPLTIKLEVIIDLRQKGKEISLVGREFLGGIDSMILELKGGRGFVEKTLARNIFPEAFPT